MDDWMLTVLGMIGVFTAGLIWMLHLDREQMRIEGKVRAMREEISALRERLREVER